MLVSMHLHECPSWITPTLVFVRDFNNFGLQLLSSWHFQEFHRIFKKLCPLMSPYKLARNTGVYIHTTGLAVLYSVPR